MVALLSFPLIRRELSISLSNFDLVRSAARRESRGHPYPLSEKYFVKVVPVLLTQRRQPSKAVVS
jgi:hypothetical protein